MNEVLATLATAQARQRRCTRTTTSTPRSRRTTSSRPRCTSPSPARSSTTSSPRSTTSPSRSRRRPSCGPASSRPAAPTSWTRRPSRSARSSAATPARSASASSACAVGAPPRRRGPARRHRRRHRHQHARRASRSSSSSCSQHETELPITEARDHFEAQANRDGLVEASGALRTIAVSLTKICNDLRWMGSGPNTGLGELRIPDLQPGSSIMPGKVNPVVPEAVLMVCARVIGNDATIAWAGRIRLRSSSTCRSPSWARRCSSRSACSRTRRACSPTRPSTASRPTSSAPRALAGHVAVDRDAAQQAHRLRGRREDRQALGRQGHHGARGRHRPRLRRARRAHRGAARRGARPALDDAPAAGSRHAASDARIRVASTAAGLAFRAVVTRRSRQLRGRPPERRPPRRRGLSCDRSSGVAACRVRGATPARSRRASRSRARRSPSAPSG